MWGIEFSCAISKLELPLATKEMMVGIAVALLTFRILLQLIIEKIIGVQGIRKQHNPNSLEYSYFYHLCIIILVLPDLNWNIFDISLWVFAYVFIGMFRKAIFTLNVERSFLLNDYSYNCHIITLIKGSQVMGACLCSLAVVWILWVHISFLGVAMKVLSLLTFPAILLAVDSVFLVMTSMKTRQNLIYFYNQNINGEPPVLQLELYHKIVGSAIRIWHFVNLSLLCFFMIYEKIDFLDCLWVVSALGAFYNSSVELVTSISKYKKSQKLATAIQALITRVPTSVDKICVICMEPLLNSYQINLCSHRFHYKCLYQWIQTKEECPICRVRIHIQN